VTADFLVETMAAVSLRKRVRGLQSGRVCFG
jgi:hypothetical protein